MKKSRFYGSILIFCVQSLLLTFLFSCSSGTAGKERHAGQTELVSTKPSELAALPLFPTISPESSRESTQIPSTTSAYPETVQVNPNPVLNEPASPMVAQASLVPGYLLLEEYNQSLTLVFLPEGKTRKLSANNANPVRLLAFTKDGCEITTSQFDRSVIQLNLQGEVLQELLAPGWYPDSGWPTPWTISPSGEWLAYLVGSGYQGYAGWEKQDLETIRLEGQMSYKLTQAGGAWDAAWSPDSDWIAFSEDDADQNNQIYLARPDGTEKTQLTNFTDSQNKTILIKWSAEGKKLAAMRHNFDDNTTFLAIIFAQEDRREGEILPDLSLPIKNFWWEDEDILVIHLEGDVDENSIDHAALIWFQTSTGLVIGHLNQSDIPDGLIISAGAFHSSVSAIFTDNSVFLYDSQTQSFEQVLGSHDFYYSGWYFSPSTFPGEQSCSSSP